MAARGEPIPSVKDLASSEAKIRRVALEAILKHIKSRKLRTSPLTPTQCLQLWRGFFVCLYMHDSKSAFSVQNLITTLAEQFRIIASKDPNAYAKPEDSDYEDCQTHDLGAGSQLSIFTTAFWETMSREWPDIDALRMDKFLSLIRHATRQLLVVCQENLNAQRNVDYVDFRSSHDRIDISKNRLITAQISIFAKWPLSHHERQVPDGLRYHVLDIWVDELEAAIGERDKVALKDTDGMVEALMALVKSLSKEGLSKGVRQRAKDVLKDFESRNILCGSDSEGEEENAA